MALCEEVHLPKRNSIWSDGVIWISLKSKSRSFQLQRFFHQMPVNATSLHSQLWQMVY